MRTTKLLSAALMLLFVSLLAASQVRADGINYSYTSGGNTFTWQVPTNPAVGAGNAYLGEGFALTGWSFLENGAAKVGTLDFWTSSWGGGFDLKQGGDFLLINAYGPQLYSGPENAPTMLTGNYPTFDYGRDFYGISQPASVELKETSVPEPSTLSLLAMGLAAGLLFNFLRFAKISHAL